MKLNSFSRIKWERARDLKRKGAYEEAETELEEALEEQPHHPLLKTSLADLYLRQDRPREARILTEGILSQHPGYPQAMYVLGEILSKESKLDEALQCFRQASAKDPSPYLIHRMARTLREMERYEEALEILDSALVTHREEIRFLKEKALILNRMEQWDEALKVYEKVQTLDPKDAVVRKEVYRLKSLNRDDEKVIRELKAVLSLPSRKEDPQLHGLLGQKLKEAGKLKEAAAEFRKAWCLLPDHLFYLKQEGYCHYRLGDYEEAIRLLSQAFRREPSDYILKKTLEKTYSLIGNLRGFIQLLEDLVAEHPHNVKLMGTLKRLKKQIGEDPEST